MILVLKFQIQLLASITIGVLQNFYVTFDAIKNF